MKLCKPCKPCFAVAGADYIAVHVALCLPAPIPQVRDSSTLPPLCGRRVNIKKTPPKNTVKTR